MFRNEAQQCRAIRLLLATVGLEHLWTDRGPTQQALEALKSSPLSSGEQLLLRCAFDLWSGEGEVLLHRDIIGKLDFARAQKLLSLALAVVSGAEAIDNWIAEQEHRDSFQTVVQ